jgi:RNA polymerase sigma-70 factor (ECF subfamily)
MSKTSAIQKAKEERVILKAVKGGDTQRFHEIESRYHDKILFYLWHLVGSKEEAEDVLQDVLVKVYKSMDQFDNRKHFSSWIYRIAHNEAINHLKKRNRCRSISWEDIVNVKDRLSMSDHQDSPQERWIRSERRVEVRHALKLLPPKYREVLLLRYYFEKSYDEVAEIIDKPRNTVGTLISRAKKKLVKVLSSTE